jgi:hypothetical protein
MKTGLFKSPENLMMLLRDGTKHETRSSIGGKSVEFVRRFVLTFPDFRLIAMYGQDYALPNLLSHLASPTCAKVGNQWDRCGAYYVNPIG